MAPTGRGRSRSKLGIAIVCVVVVSVMGTLYHGLEELTPSVESGGALLRSGYFTENVGQVPNDGIRFYGGVGGVRVGFAESAILITTLEPVPPPPTDSGLSQWHVGPPVEAEHLKPVHGVLLRVTFEQANPVSPLGRYELPIRSNFFIGNDSSKWYTDVRSFREVVYENLYEGIDLVYRAGGSALKYDFIVRPGANPSRIEMVFEGVESLDADINGNLVIRTAIGSLHDSALYAYQDSEEVACAFHLKGTFSVGVECHAWDVARPLVIDPLIYSTFLGGTRAEYGSIALDDAGSAYVTGSTESTDFPATPGVFDATKNGGRDAFAAKLNPEGSALIYATFLGGDGWDAGASIDIDSARNAYVTGFTESTDFPTTPGADDATHNGGRDAFVVKLNADGTSLSYATVLGGDSEDGGVDLAVDSAGSVYVVGSTASPDFPVTAGGFGTSLSGGYDTFVAKLDSGASTLIYCGLVGGSEGDWANGLDVDASGNVYVIGSSDSSDFPTTPGAFDMTANGARDAFLAKVNAVGSALMYSTVLGGGALDHGFSVSVDVAGNAYVSGRTASVDFPTTPSALDTTHNGGEDVYAARLSADGSSLSYSTLLGGGNWDQGIDITVDSIGAVHLTGFTESTDFPTTSDAFDTVFNGGRDAFIATIGPAGDTLEYSTFLGASGWDSAGSIVVDSAGNVYLGGLTSSFDFPVTPSAFDTSYNGESDAFVVKLSLNEPPTGPACPLSKGFWKAHPENWPISSLDLGNETYDKTELLTLLRMPPRGDASLILAHQLIAAALNVANGSNPHPIAAELAEAQSLLAAFAGLLPYNVRPSSFEGTNMTALAETLDMYNNGYLTPECGPP